MKSKTFVCGDIHGGNKALLQVLERSNFDYANDTLIQLGDVADGWPEVPACVETLRQIKNIIQIKGNHDEWLLSWFEKGWMENIWTSQGGAATLRAYSECDVALIKKHAEYWKKARLYYVDNENRIYCHGGFDPFCPIEEQSEDYILWDRTLAGKAVVAKKNGGLNIPQFKHAFLGHTTVNAFASLGIEANKPLTSGNVTLMDTGAGFEGCLTLMDVDTMEYWQSDIVKSLYPSYKHR